MESIHAKLEREVEKEEQAQKKLEEILSQRRDIMAKLRKCNNKICKEKEAHAADFQAD